MFKKVCLSRSGTKKLFSAGYYCGSGTDQQSQRSCSPGDYCPKNSVTPLKCPAGKYCATQNLAAPSEDCAGGYYCDGMVFVFCLFREQACHIGPGVPNF